MSFGFEFLDDTMWTSKEIYEYTVIKEEKPFLFRITPTYGDTIDDADWTVELIDEESGERLSEKVFHTLNEASSYANHKILIIEHINKGGE